MTSRRNRGRRGAHHERSAHGVPGEAANPGRRAAVGRLVVLRRAEALGAVRLSLGADRDGRLQALAHQVLVMKGGQVVESGEALAVLQNPTHPYTRVLVAALQKIG